MPCTNASQITLRQLNTVHVNLTIRISDLVAKKVNWVHEESLFNRLARRPNNRLSCWLYTQSDQSMGCAIWHCRTIHHKNCLNLHRTVLCFPIRKIQSELNLRYTTAHQSYLENRWLHLDIFRRKFLQRTQDIVLTPDPPK